MSEEEITFNHHESKTNLWKHCFEEHRAIKQRIGEEGIVLLKIKNVLPINVAKTKKIAVIGKRISK